MTVTQMMGKEVPTAAKLNQVLSINPSTQITFRGDFSDVVSVDLTLTNPTNRRVCFKVKTNYPHRYFVRPNGGLIEASQQQIITIMLQPLEIIEEEMRLHKFMVQAMFVPDGPINGLEKLWKETRPESIMDTKIKCVFEPIHISKLEIPRFRGVITEPKADDNNEPKQTSQKQDVDRKPSGDSSSTAAIFIVLILLGLVLFAYLKLK